MLKTSDSARAASHNIIIAFDHGKKNIGVAIGQTITKTARPLAILLANEGTPDWGKVKELLRTWQPDALLVGVPIGLDGKVADSTLAANNFISELAHHCELPIYTSNELFTTQAARMEGKENPMFRKQKDQRVDSIAAKIMLEEWLQLYT